MGTPRVYGGEITRQEETEAASQHPFVSWAAGKNLSASRPRRRRDLRSGHYCCLVVPALVKLCPTACTRSSGEHLCGTIDQKSCLYYLIWGKSVVQFGAINIVKNTPQKMKK